MQDLLRFALAQFKLPDQPAAAGASPAAAGDCGYQLISTCVYALPADGSLLHCERLFLPHDRDLHLCLLRKRIRLRLALRLADRQTLLAVEIDPVRPVLELKQLAAELAPINWTQHVLAFHGQPLGNHQVLFGLGIGDLDQLTVDPL